MRRKIKEATGKVEQWSYNCGFKLSAGKSDRQDLKLYGHNMEPADHFKYLGMWSDRKATWETHVEKVEVLNVLRAERLGSK